MKKQKYKLIASDIQLEALLSQSPTGVLIIDNSGFILNYNKLALKFFKIENLKPKQNLFDSIDDIELKIPVKKIIESRHRQLTLNLGLSKKLSYLHVTGAILFDRKENQLGKLITIEKKSLNKRFRKLREDFVANVSHELKTPLTVIKGSVETLKKGALNNSAEAEHFVNIIAKHTDRLNGLINDILNLSNIEQKIKRRDITFAKCKVGVLIDEVVQMYKGRIQNAGYRLVVKCDFDIDIVVNKRLIEMALSNLVDNAIKYNRKNGIIKICAFNIGESIQIDIKDSGIGIQQKHIPRLFERFYRIDKLKSRSIGGTGLGLSIVKQITNLHNGLITVKSDIDKGSTFTIILPCIHEE